jgi:hypothetical protein
VIAMTVTPLQSDRPGRPVAGGIRLLTTAEPTAPQPETDSRPEDDRPDANSIEAMLAAADASSQQKLRTKAARLREQIIELAGLVEIEAEARKVEAQVKQLRDELQAAETALRALRHPATSTPKPATTPATVTSTREITRAVRAWANTNGIEVNAHGRVPNDLVQRWQAATGGIQ